MQDGDPIAYSGYLNHNKAEKKLQQYCNIA